ncbi:hypothetical protein [Kitasatospora phosalacinea]|uniref:Uncharacterized protein n=1 Tax=Kitasatospora phosalacinea TaxID=2065 RepID=A0A9W6PJD5_9ACTN|nr:hypothetical protein [Kitasatospora phosalacinea]GLW56095.1 hypothetical protein Kpho01_41060 [Kitasatospora phosalacinea]
MRTLTYEVPPGTPEPQRPSGSWHPETAFGFSLDRPGASGSGIVRERVGWSGVPDFNDPAAPPVAAKCVAPAADLYVIAEGYRFRR